MLIRLSISAYCILVVYGSLSFTGRAWAQANVVKECGSRYQAAKAANQLGGRSWQEFLKACRAELSETKNGVLGPEIETTKSSPPPEAADPAKFAGSSKAAEAERQKACGAEWKAHKKRNPEASWPKFWSQCTTHLKECGSRYQAAKAANQLGSRSWQEFLKACRAELSETTGAARVPRRPPTPPTAGYADGRPPTRNGRRPTPMARPALRPAVQESGYDFLYAKGSERDGYGLYSYVILHRGGAREAAFLKEIFSRVRHASELPTIEHGEINIIYIPATKDVSNPPSPRPLPPDSDQYITKFLLPGSDLGTHYDFSMATLLLHNLCETPANTVQGLCEGDLSGGPYILTYGTKASALRPLPPPFLFVDLTSIHQKAFGQIVSAYLSQVKRAKFSDREKIDTFRLKLLNLILISAESMQPISAALAGIIH